MPNIEFSFKDDVQLRLRWWRDDPAAAQFERVLFQADGELEAEPKAIQHSLQDFVVSVLRRLQERAPQHPRTLELQETWQLATDPLAPDHVAQHRAALLGLFWHDLPATWREDLRQLASQDLQEMEQDLLQAAMPKEAGSYLAEARAVLQAGAAAPAATNRWRDLWSRVASVPTDEPRNAAPWKRGWDSARRLRAALGENAAAMVEPTALWDAIQSSQHALALPRVDAIVAWSSGRQPVRAIQGSGSNRFGLARDLHPVLFGPSPDTRHAVVHSRLVVGSSSLANAFATELLAPAERVRALIGTRRTIDYDDLDEIAKALGAPYSCVAHQVENHHLARVSNY